MGLGKEREEKENKQKESDSQQIEEGRMERMEGVD
jgi:hypothetical protein